MAKHGPAHRHLNPAVQVVAIAGELLIRLDADVDVQVAGSAAALTHFALVGQPQTRVVVDAGGHGNAHGTRGAHTAVAHAAGARVLDDGTVASQRSQGAEVIIWPSMVRTTFCMNPCPWQSGQVTGCAPPWAPEPPHSWHRENVLILTCAVPPNTAVFKSMDAEAKASRPGW